MSNDNGLASSFLVSIQVRRCLREFYDNIRFKDFPEIGDHNNEHIYPYR